MTGRRICVIGAGAAGLCAARHLLDRGLAVDVLEREADIGGIWNPGLPIARVYASTEMISSKPFTQFPDFPMPDHFPDYPHHTQVLAYLRSYSEAFELGEHIELRTGVDRVEPEEEHEGEGEVDPGVAWRVRLESGQARRYDAVVIANGHNHTPRWPSFQGRFDGQTLHAAHYRTPAIFEEKRILVVGGGNSGCDIAVEAAQHAAATFLSLRRGYHFIPKYVFRWPVDQVGDVLHRLRFPLWLRRAIARIVLRAVRGNPRRSGLPRPDHALFETHPVVNTLLPRYVRHGHIGIRPDVERLDGDAVVFTDGRREQIDVIVYATGYRIHVPFLDPALLNGPEGRPRLWLHVFHPTLDTLFAVGMVQADSGVFGIVHEQARAVAGFLAGVWPDLAASRVVAPSATAVERVRRAKGTATEAPGSELTGGIRYRSSARHHLEVEHWSYRRRLERLADSLA
jgi:cation diffusion facilitator CzcD-associated flavoprotein CzcO